jgi:hypothetical protein
LPLGSKKKSNKFIYQRKWIRLNKSIESFVENKKKYSEKITRTSSTFVKRFFFERRNNNKQ